MSFTRLAVATRSVLLLLLFVGIAVSSGCAYNIGPNFGQNRGDFEYGSVFRSVRTPLTLDLNNTPVGSLSGEGKVIHIEEPFTGAGMYSEFSTNAIADIAKKHGLKKVYFADIESFSILGIFRHQKLIIYGE